MCYQPVIKYETLLYITSECKQLQAFDRFREVTKDPCMRLTTAKK